VIGHSHPRVSEILTGCCHLRDRGRAVAPGRVHLQIAPVVVAADDLASELDIERLLEEVMAQKAFAQFSQVPDLRGLSRARDGGVDGRRVPLLDEFGDDARTRRSDVRYVPQRIRSHPIGDSVGQTHHRSRCALVAQATSLRFLKSGHVVQE
jgi:uncharacterized protein YijF (DUF1287 family)